MIKRTALLRIGQVIRCTCQYYCHLSPYIKHDTCCQDHWSHNSNGKHPIRFKVGNLKQIKTITYTSLMQHNTSNIFSRIFVSFSLCSFVLLNFCPLVLLSFCPFVLLSSGLQYFGPLVLCPFA